MSSSYRPDSGITGRRLDGDASHEALGDLHLAADAFASAIEAYHAALAEQPRDAVRDRVRLMLRIARVEMLRGRPADGLAMAHAAHALARPLRDAQLGAQVAAGLAILEVERGAPRRALRYARWAYAVLRDTDQHVLVAWISLAMGYALARTGQPAAAIEWLQSAAATFRRVELADGLVSALNNLGLVHKNLREWREAIRHLEQALEIDARHGLFARMRGHHQNLGLIRYRLGQWSAAEAHFQQSLRIARDVAHGPGEAGAKLALGLLARRQRRFDEAEACYREAAALAERVGAARESELAREYLAELELDRGDGARALAILEPALAEARVLAPRGDLVMELEIRIGIAQRLLAHHDEAHASLTRGLALAESSGDRVEQAIALRELARVDAARGDAAAMEARLGSAVLLFEALGESYELATTLAAWPDCVAALSASARGRVVFEPVADAARRAALLFRQLELVPLAAEALLSLARLERERERFDQALGLLEQAEHWLGERTDLGAEGRAISLRREIEQQYVAVSLSTCNEFRALEEANRLFRETTDVEGLLARIVQLAVEHTGGDRGFVAFSAGAGRFDVVTQHGVGRDRARRILRAIESAAGDRIAESGPLFASRVAADPRFGRALADALEGVTSLVCVPLNFPSQAVGLVYVDRLHDNLLGAFQQRDLNLLAVLANSAAVAVVEAQRSRLLAENQQLRDQLRTVPGEERVVGASREVTAILQLLRKVSDSPATILFMGETGTGKGLFARLVHDMSSRREAPFVQVNCAALPEQLLESELFGHVQGSFTGATRDKVGLFEEAAGGTLFLDEIEKIPEAMQAKLLHVLDRGEFRPVGATRTRRVEARVVCATGGDLLDRIRAGRFLEDLYYRLNDITVRVPALRERREDIPVLAQHFLETYARQLGKRIEGFSPEVIRLLHEWEWRGNVRELEKTVKRMVVLADDGDVLGATLLPAELRALAEGATAPAAAARRGPARSLRMRVADLERGLIAESLERHRGNKSKVARELGLSYPTLLGRIKSYRLEASDS